MNKNKMMQSRQDGLNHCAIACFTIALREKVSAMTESNHELTDNLLGRVVSILEQARGHVVRAINSNMVIAYCLIRREIVQALQGGDRMNNF